MKRFFLTAFSLLAAASAAGGLYAQSEENFLKSVALSYNISIDKRGANRQSMGIVVNLYIFPNDGVGYYVSPGMDLRMKHGTAEPEEMDIYLGAVFGPAFRAWESGGGSIAAGAGVDFSCIVRLRKTDGGSLDHERSLVGLGLGGSLEARMKLHDNISFAAGLLAKHNFSPYAEDRTLIARPYMGIGF
jgi:hypothetical protein